MMFKVKSMLELPAPKTLTQFAWLGLIGYYRKFVKNYATVAYPLTEFLNRSYSLRQTPKSFHSVRNTFVVLCCCIT